MPTRTLMSMTLHLSRTRHFFDADIMTLSNSFIQPPSIPGSAGWDGQHIQLQVVPSLLFECHVPLKRKQLQPLAQGPKSAERRRYGCADLQNTMRKVHGKLDVMPSCAGWRRFLARGVSHLGSKKTAQGGEVSF